MFKGKYEKIINDNDYISISSTAIVTSYPRTFTDIPYEKSIYECIKKKCNNEEVVLNKMLAPEIEARYKLTNKLLENTKINQVLELAAGYSSRGLIYSQKGYNYIEMDLKNVSDNKKKIINEISEMNNNLHIISGNALRKTDFDKCKQYLNKNNEVAVINEGLLRYLTFDEKRQVAQNIFNLLSEYGGVWITCDVTPKKFIQNQDENLPNFNQNLNNITERNKLNDRFENVEHIREFFGEIGFSSIEVHKFSEMKNFLTSIGELKIDINNVEKLLDEAIVVVMKI